MATQGPVDVTRPQLPISVMEDIFPSQTEARAIERSAFPAPPGAPLTNLGDTLTEKTKAADLEFENFARTEGALKSDRANRPPGALETSEGLVAAASLAGAAAAAPFVGPLPVVQRMAAMGLSGGIPELMVRLTEGESFGEALPKAATTTAFFAGAEGAGAGLAKVGGFAFRGMMDLGRKARAGVRRLRGKDPLPETPRIESTSAPFQNFMEIEAQEVSETILGLGGSPKPAQLVQHNLIDSTQKVLEKSAASRTGTSSMMSLDTVFILPRILSACR